MEQAVEERAPVVLYDADCGFCTWVVDRIAARVSPGSLELVPLRSDRADRVLDGRLSDEAKWESWHLVDPDGSLYSGGDAIPHVLRHVKGGRALGRLAARFPRPAAAAYRLVARHRDRLGRVVRAERCRVPGAD